jgi:hypothetical protein
MRTSQLCSGSRDTCNGLGVRSSSSVSLVSVVPSKAPRQLHSCFFLLCRCVHVGCLYVFFFSIAVLMWSSCNRKAWKGDDCDTPVAVQREAAAALWLFLLSCYFGGALRLFHAVVVWRAPTIV